MKEQEKVLDEKQKGESLTKRPYKTPRLERLGKVKEVTEGVPPSILPDVAGTSF